MVHEVAEDVVESFNCSAVKVASTSQCSLHCFRREEGMTRLSPKTTIANFSSSRSACPLRRVVPASSSGWDEEAASWFCPWQFESISDNTLWPCLLTKLATAHSCYDDKLHLRRPYDPTARLTAQQDGTTLAMEMVPQTPDQLKGAGRTDAFVGFFAPALQCSTLARLLGTTLRFARHASMHLILHSGQAEVAVPATFLLPLLTITRHPPSMHTMQKRLRSLFLSLASLPDVVLRTTDNEQVKSMATQVKNDLDLAF